MPPFPRPAFTYNYQVQSQINALRRWRDTEPGRAIPAKAANRLLLATWNIANLGLQQRRDQDHSIPAELIGWFDLVAVQEVHDNLSGVRDVPVPLRLSSSLARPGRGLRQRALIGPSARSAARSWPETALCVRHTR